jgi:mono/diheme cytochrome c family protein
MSKLVKVLVGLVAVAAVVVAAGVAYLYVALPAVSPAPDIAVEATPERLARGRYLAEHVMGCRGCHTERREDRYAYPPVAGREWAGGLRWGPENDFPGTLFSPNITPYALKRWSDGEIYRAITAGVRRDGEPLFPVMPYALFGRAEPEDITAVIAYLRSLPEVAAEWPGRSIDFPLNLIMRTIPADPEPRRRPAGGEAAALGEYLVTIAGCTDCHTAFEGGEFVGEPFAGGRAFRYPGLGLFRSANITPDEETGIGAWSRDDFVARFTAVAPEDYAEWEVAPGEPNTIMPWWEFAAMTETDLAAIYAYLRTLPPVANQVTTFEPLPASEQESLREGPAP